MDQSKTILIIEGDKSNTKRIKTLLAEEGFDILSAGTAQEGYKKIINNKPGLALIAAKLPDMPAHDLCVLIRGNLLTQDTPIIILNNSLTSDEQSKILEMGADKIIPKTSESAELISCVQMILKSGRNLTKDEELFRHKKPSPIIDHHQNHGLNFLLRLNQILNHPREAAENIEDPSNMLMTLLIVVLTPLLASLPKIFQREGNFDVWIGILSLGLVTNLLTWFVLGGLLHMTFPFLGSHINMRESLLISGLSWAPKLIGAFASVLYSLIALFKLIVENSDFSAGINLIPGLPSNLWVGFLSRIGIFDFWSTWVLLSAVWVKANLSQRKWNFITTLIGLVSLAFGAFSSY